MRKKAYYQAIELCKKGFSKHGENMLKIWLGYCHWKLGDNTKFLSVLADLEGQ